MLPCLKLVGSLASHRLPMRSWCLGSWAVAPYGPRSLSLCPPSPYCIQRSNFLMKNINDTGTQWSQHHLQMEKIQSNPSSIPTTSHWQPTCHPVFPLWALRPCCYTEHQSKGPTEDGGVHKISALSASGSWVLLLREPGVLVCAHAGSVWVEARFPSMKDLSVFPGLQGGVSSQTWSHKKRPELGSGPVMAKDSVYSEPQFHISEKETTISEAQMREDEQGPCEL